MLHYLPHIAIAVPAVFVMVWRAEGDDPAWEARWAALACRPASSWSQVGSSPA